MSDTISIQEALKQAGAPDYMVLIITKIMGAEDAIREMQAALSARSVDLDLREQTIESRAQLLDDRQKSFVDAANDMKAFANRLYGPDSELTKIHAKLGAIESASLNRDKKYADRFQNIDENQSRLKDWVESQVRDVETRVGLRVANIEERLEAVERKIA